MSDSELAGPAVDPRLAGLINDFLDLRPIASADPTEFARGVGRLIETCPEELMGRFLVFLGTEGVPDDLLDPALPVGDELTVQTTYRIQGRHGEGGMGRVYLAYDETLGRNVALKVMRRVVSGGWFDAPGDRDRFLGEASITAGLGHPSVPSVYGATRGKGESPTFYVMRLVEQEKTVQDAIDEIHGGHRRDRAFTSPRSRGLIRHLREICEAVDQAHGRGFVHRDLKPSNIALDEGARRAWVLDWGLARRRDWTSPSTSEEAAESVYRTIAGTLPYMSPEQASGRGPCAPASDIYGLGAILYHILTGRPPFTTRAGDSPISIDSLQAAILKGEFPPPRAINRSAPERLERICLKAMAKDPGRRFESAGLMAKELTLWAEDEPASKVGEPPLERAYRIAVRRYPDRSLTVAAALIVVAGLALVGSTVIARITKTEADRTRMAYEFLDEDMQAGRIAQGMNRDVTLAQVLDQAVPRIDGRFGHDPESEARIKLIVAHKYRFIGMYSSAEPLARRAVELRRQYLAPDDGRTVVAMTELAAILGESGKFDEAEPMIRTNLGDSLRILGEAHVNTSAAMVSLALLLADRARQESSRSYAMTEFNAVPSVTAAWDEAEALLRRAIRIQGKILGEDAMRTLSTINNLGALLLDRGKAQDAAPLLADAVAVCRRTLGGDHPLTIAATNTLATARIKIGMSVDDGELERNLDIARRVMGRTNPRTRSAIENIVTVNLGRGDPKSLAKAEPYAREFWELLKEVNGPVHSETLMSLEVFSRLLLKQNKYREAEPLLRELVATRRRLNHHPATLGLALQAHGFALLECGDARAAERPLLEAKAIFNEVEPQSGLYSALVDSTLLGCWTTLGRLAEAEGLVLPIWTTLEPMPEKVAELKIRSLARIIRLFEVSNKPEVVAYWRAKRDALIAKEPKR